MQQAAFGAVLGTVLAFISAAILFFWEERSRRRRHSQALKAALRAELQRSERVLATYVYLWDHEAEPTPRP